MSLHRSSHPMGFTLIELLAVVSIKDTLLTCPTLQSELPTLTWHYHRNYGMNYWMAYDMAIPADPVNQFLRLQQILKPSAMSYFFDGSNDPFGDQWWYRHGARFGLHDDRFQYPHNGGNNFSFVDGHGKTLAESQVTPHTNKDPFWRGANLN